MNEKQQQQLLEIKRALGRGVLPEELSQVVEVLLSVMKDLKAQLESQIGNVKSESSTSIKEISYTLNDLELKIKGLINSSEGTTLSKIKELSTRMSTEMKRMEDMMPMMPDMPDFTLVEQKIKEIESKIPVVTPDTAEQVRDKLETLGGDNRLDISAIKGIGSRLSKLTDDIINRAIGILDSRSSFLLNKVSNLQTTVNSLAAHTATGANVETPTESPDGSRTTFTVTHTPIFIISDRLIKILGVDFTFSSPTITITDGSPPVQIIRSVY